ncbi:MAG: hypothetical protein MSIBF_06855 [Candidatus Altiarchaeales archaeon IMC4]|nr:MAG: hypothetical protein MSIBF_06855 [Candidatus Altiarchaeales archaeon IMC4]
MDKICPELRSKVMSRIKAKNTQPELILRMALWKKGLMGYRLHCMLPGRPDIVYSSRKVAIFVDGDFWHGYLWKVKGNAPPEKILAS